MFTRSVTLLTAAFLLWGCMGGFLTKPTLKNQVELKYPYTAQKEGIQGLVELQLYITKEGDVLRAKIQKSSGNEILDAAALDYATKLQFNPAMKDKKPVAVNLSWRVNYKFTDSDNYTNKYTDNYVNAVLKFYDEVNAANTSEKNSILQQILSQHEKFAVEMQDNIHANRYIRQVISPETELMWNRIWDEYPLRFVVFQDFINRFGDTAQAAIAKEDLQRIVLEDITNIKNSILAPNTGDGLKEHVLKRIYTFLKKDYPDLIPADLAPEVDAYLNKPIL